MMLSIFFSTLLAVSSGVASTEIKSSEAPSSSTASQAISSLPQEAQTRNGEPAMLKPCFVNGSAQALECGFLEVTKDYSYLNEPKSGSNTDMVKIYVIRSSAKSLSAKKLHPLFIFAGGPGQGATDFTHLLKTSFEHIAKRRDIVFVAQRGTGQSHAITCQQLNLTTYDTLAPEMKRCRQEIKPLMPQLNTYTLIRDIDAVRESLGYQSIHLWGGSYGTFAAQLYTTYFPERVSSMILDAAFALDANPLVNSSAYAQQSLETVAQACKNDLVCHNSFPNWEHELYQLLSFENDSFENGSKNAHASEILMPDMLSGLVRAILYSPDMAAKLPYAIHHAFRGDTTVLETMNQIFAESMGKSMYIGLTLSTLCQEMVFKGQSEKARKVGKDSFVKDNYYQFWKSACGNEDNQQAAYVRKPDNLTTQTLLISGSLDPVTSVSSANHVKRYLPNTQHVIIPNAGHTNSHLGCMPKVINEFLNDVDDFNNHEKNVRGVQKINNVDASCILNNQFPAFMR